MPKGFTATIILLPGYTSFSVSLLTEPWRRANGLRGSEAVVWQVTSWSGDAVEAAGGASLEIEAAAKSANGQPDLVVLVGGEELQRAPEKAMISWLRKIEETGTLIGGVGAGADVIERAELLYAGGGSVPMEAATAFRQRHVGPTLAHGLYTMLGNCAVCAGGSTGLDFSLALLAHFMGEELADQVSESLVYRRRPSELELVIPPATLRRADPRLTAAVHRLSALLDGSANSVKAAADAAGLSERQLLRIFRQAFGMAPRSFQESLRLERARTLLRETGMTIVAIALAVGFAGGPELSRAFQRHFAESPTSYRARVR